MESLALKHSGCLYSYSQRERGDLFIRRMKEYQIDGLVVWSDICCKHYALFANYLKARAEKELGIPGLILDSDQCDPRDYNEGILKGRIDAFIEVLENRRKTKII